MLGLCDRWIKRKDVESREPARYIDALIEGSAKFREKCGFSIADTHIESWGNSILLQGEKCVVYIDASFHEGLIRIQFLPPYITTFDELHDSYCARTIEWRVDLSQLVAVENNSALMKSFGKISRLGNPTRTMLRTGDLCELLMTYGRHYIESF